MTWVHEGLLAHASSVVIGSQIVDWSHPAIRLRSRHWRAQGRLWQFSWLDMLVPHAVLLALLVVWKRLGVAHGHVVERRAAPTRISDEGPASGVPFAARQELLSVLTDQATRRAAADTDPPRSVNGGTQGVLFRALEAANLCPG